jgi:hypothetical protein
LPPDKRTTTHADADSDLGVYRFATRLAASHLTWAVMEVSRFHTANLTRHSRHRCDRRHNLFDSEQKVFQRNR